MCELWDSKCLLVMNYWWSMIKSNDCIYKIMGRVWEGDWLPISACKLNLVVMSASEWKMLFAFWSNIYSYCRIYKLTQNLSKIELHTFCTNPSLNFFNEFTFKNTWLPEHHSLQLVNLLYFVTTINMSLIMQPTLWTEWGQQYQTFNSSQCKNLYFSSFPWKILSKDS